jgi:hypothetical protein
MEKAGICMHCNGLASPAYTCRMCGAIVCESCFDHELGFCRICAAKIKPGKRKCLRGKIKSMK